MPALTAVSSTSTILVTGANGFIGTWIVGGLLQRGYNVRAAVRVEGKGKHLLETYKAYGDKLKIQVVGDITEEGALDEAVKGVEGVIHSASQVHLGAVSPKDIIDPAVNGVVGMLTSALKNGSSLRRIIFTSSCVAILDTSEVPVTISEADWNDPPIIECEEKGKAASPLAMYSASKTLAEKGVSGPAFVVWMGASTNQAPLQAAWDFYRKHQSDVRWDFAVINPPWVFGPVIHEVTTVDTLNSSSKFWYNAIVKGDFAGTSPLTSPGHAWTDVRDVAEAHVRALEVPAAGGERIMVVAEPMVWQDWLDAANSLSPPPYHTLAKGDVGTVQRAITFDKSKESRILGLKFRAMKESVRDILIDYTRRGW